VAFLSLAILSMNHTEECFVKRSAKLNSKENFNASSVELFL
jgi:hypothetical protein